MERCEPCSLAEYAEHYAAGRDLGERLALTRARPDRGRRRAGRAIHGGVSAVCIPRQRAEAGVQIPATRAVVPRYQIETLTQAFQLAHGSQHAALRSTSTLGTLEALARARLLPEQVCRELDHAYVFLRTAEHRKQLGLADADMDKQVEASRARVRELCAHRRLR